jgi:hypothetical protein
MAHGGQRRIQQRRQIDVVDPDHRNSCAAA